MHCGSSAETVALPCSRLLFCKGDKELAHCDVPARPEYASEVTEFLKKQFEDNGIDKRHYAREAVVVDEVFALCCRKAEPDSHVMVECGVAPDAQMVNIRVTAVLAAWTRWKARALIRGKRGQLYPGQRRLYHL